MATKEKTVWRDTGKPTGLSIKRSGQSFACSWKIGDDNYGDGQYFEWCYYVIGAKKSMWTEWASESVGKAQTKKTIKIDARDLIDHYNGAKIGAVKFSVCGIRKDYKTTSEKGSDTIVTTHKSRPSGWSEKKYTLEKPHKPIVTAQWDSNYVDKTVFSWKTTTSSTSPKWFLGAKYQAMLVKNTTQTDGSKLTWKKSGTDWKEGELQGGTYAEHSIPVTEDSATVNDSLDSYTRFFRCKALGAKGDSEWDYARHVYAKPFQAQIIDGGCEGIMLAKGAMDIAVNWKSPSGIKGKGNHPIDQTTVEYKIQQPAAGMVPSEGGWSQAGVIKDTKGQDGLRFSIDDLPDEDQVVFVRVNNEHDKNGEYGINRGVPTIPKITNGGQGEPYYWKLSAPTFRITDKNPQTKIMTVVIDSQSAVPDSRIIVGEIGYKRENDVYPINKLLYAQTSKADTTFQVKYSPSLYRQDFYIYDVVADDIRTYTDIETIDDTDSVTVTGVIMKSSEVHTLSPSIPQNVGAIGTIIDSVGTIAVNWSWSGDVDGIDLSWSDHIDAWESTDQPEEYEVGRANVGKWNISGLEVGKVWYVRTRFYTDVGGEHIYGEWGDIVDVNLKSSPTIPNLMLSKPTITDTDTVEASWAYSSADGTGQSQAVICLMEEQDGEYVPIDERMPIAKVGSAQHVTINAKDAGMSNGNTYLLSVKVKSAGGMESDGWSMPATLNVAAKPTVTVQSVSNITMNQTVLDDVEYELDHEVDGFAIDINELFDALEGYAPTEIELTKNDDTWTIAYDSTSLTTEDLEEYGIYGANNETHIIVSNIVVVSHTANILQALPIIVTATGAGVDGSTNVSIRRVGDYRLLRPDESEYNGFDGEIIASVTQDGDSVIVEEDNNTIDRRIYITKDFCIGSLDDGEKYVLNVTVVDTYGQSVESDDLEFEVHWNKQAHMPLGTVVITDDNIAKITPIAPSEWVAGDVCDIYRLSADKPELIYPNAEFGVTYVDPYPAIGEHGGHRIVYKTEYDDFITAKNERAVLDLGSDDDDVLDRDYAIVDFNGMQIPLYYNVDISHQWQKDFVETKYLGGSVQGDWNEGISRSASVGTVMMNLINEDDIIKMKKLAAYTGVCHLRTMDGSSFACDLQVSENRPHDKRNMVTTFSISVTRVDGEGYDGLTLEQWNNIHEVE